jgi:hypothetical protein
MSGTQPSLLQLQPGSYWQCALQPSPDWVLPSSQNSSSQVEPPAPPCPPAPPEPSSGSGAERSAIPSPQRIRWHACSAGQAYPGVCLQVAPQPSPPSVLPSSHSSPFSSRPLPHPSARHLPVVYEQAQPSSRRQLSWQPSPGTRFPSSHRSSPSRTPSPQCCLQTDRPSTGKQDQPNSTRHPLQPSPDTLLPSSHTSEASIAPSPHSMSTRRLQGPSAGHHQPLSTWHQEQPSPETWLPSSHSSLRSAPRQVSQPSMHSMSLTPSPQRGAEQALPGSQIQQP